jgi:hypothetical protein
MAVEHGLIDRDIDNAYDVDVCKNSKKTVARSSSDRNGVSVVLASILAILLSGAFSVC